MKWDNIEEISANLEKNYEDEDLPENSLPYLHEMVLSLKDFEDHEIEPNEDTLREILEAWKDLREER